MLNLLISPLANLASTWLEGKVETSKAAAETKVAQVNEYSAECDHPLLCEIQKLD